MGSENSPNVLFSAVVQAAQQLKDVTFTVFATPPAIEAIKEMQTWKTIFENKTLNIEFQAVSEVIEMADSPILSIRQKKNSSLVLGMRLLKRRFLDAFVSAGNTGALIASAALSLPLLPGIKRPALLATLPTKRGYVAVIDVGGNVSCKAHHLVQFAQIGAAYQLCAQSIQSPLVGLLNIGVESKKGTSEVQQAYQILQEKMQDPLVDQRKMRFVGNVEGREVFQGKVDVLVTNGFNGNILLKTSEGIVSFMLEHLREALKEAPEQIKKSVFSHLQYEFEYDEYPGALICGVERVAIKCHGKTSEKGFFNAILGSAELVRNGFIDQIKQQL